MKEGNVESGIYIDEIDLTVWRAVGMVVAIALVVLFLLKKTTLDIVLIGLFLCAQSIFKKDESK